ncbi:MAG: hypothetical protein ABIO55_15520 [Ginsengibacter sp.]
MVEVFKTNVQKVTQANRLKSLLLDHFPGRKINFDLQDCDKILRIDGANFITEKVTLLINENGFVCNVLE